MGNLKEHKIKSLLGVQAIEQTNDASLPLLSTLGFAVKICSKCFNLWILFFQVTFLCAGPFANELAKAVNL